MIDTLFRTVLLVTIKTSILTIFILIVKRLFKNTFSAKWHYFIWIVLIIKLLCNNFFESDLSIYNYANDTIVSIEKSINFDVSQETENISHQNNLQRRKSSNNIDYITVVSYFWIVIVVILFISLLLSIKVKKNRDINNKLCEDERFIRILMDNKKILNMKRKILIYFDNSTSVPYTYGIISPKIYLPDISGKYSDTEIKYILMHELVHIKRFDGLYKVISLLFCIINWFNPLFWYSFIVFREDCELSCDESVMKILLPNQYKQYGKTIINVAENTIQSKQYIIRNAMIMNKKQLQNRILSIISFSRKSIKNVIASFIMILLIIIFTVPDAVAKDIISEQVEALMPEEVIQLENYFGMMESDLFNNLGEPNKIIDPKVGEVIVTYRYIMNGTIVDFQFPAFEEDSLWAIKTNTYLGVSLGMNEDEVISILGKNFKKIDDESEYSIVYSYNNYQFNLYFNNKNILNDLVLRTMF